MTVSKVIVFCYLPGETVAVPAGQFTHDSVTGVGSFTYGRRYIELPNALPLDFAALPLGVEPIPVVLNGGLYGTFRDASPDYWGRLVIASRLQCASEAISEVDYLIEANATRVGNLDFRMSINQIEPTLSPPEFQDLDKLMNVAEALEDGKIVDKNLSMFLEQGSSLGGARPKCTVDYSGDLWLAKFSSKGDSISIPRLEYATMQLATICGLNVPDVKLVTIGERDIFLIKRFDRFATASGWSRSGFMSSLSLAEWDEKDRERWSYPKIAECIRRYALNPANDMHELFRRIAFNIAVRNNDDHPRNHGFLITREGVELSPLYDVVPSLARVGVGTEFFLAMSIGEQGRLANFNNLCSAATAFGLSDMDAEEITDEVKLVVAKGWKKELVNAGFNKNSISLMAPSFRMCGSV